MSKRFCQKPSQILNIEDEYTAYCFDEACSFIMFKIDNKEEPKYETHYATPSEMYKHLEG